MNSLYPILRKVLVQVTKIATTVLGIYSKVDAIILKDKMI